MNRAVGPLSLFAVILVLALVACDPAKTPRGPEENADAAGPGAFDVVKMERLGLRVGPVYFNHAIHAELPGLDGKTLPCAYCHLEKCGEPRRCGECHVPGVRGTRPKVPST